MGHDVTTTEYLAALDQLGLRPASRATASMLGLSLRQCQRIAAGQAPVSRTLELLLKNLIAVRANPSYVAPLSADLVELLRGREFDGMFCGKKPK